MILNGNPVQTPGIGIQMRLPSFIKRISYLLVLLLIANTTFAAEEPEEQFLQNYILIEKADSLLKNSQPDAAKLNYRKAQAGLSYLKKTNPAWKPKVVDYRLRYVTDKIAALTKPAEAPATSPAAAEDSAPGAAAKGSTTGKVQIKVLEQGSEPRQVLRLQPKVGDTQKETMVIKQSMVAEPGGAMTMPTISLAMDLTVNSVAENGDITYEMTYGEATAADEPGKPSPMTELFKESLAAVSGLKGSGIISSRGIYRPVEIKLPAGANPQLRQTVDQMKESISSASTPLPEEAIGVGAKWEVKQPIKIQTLTLTQTSIYELVSLEGGQITIKATNNQTGSHQKLKVPMMAGMEADINKLTGVYSGVTTWDPARVLPITGSLEGDVEFQFSMMIQNQKQSMTMKQSMKLVLETK